MNNRVFLRARVMFLVLTGMTIVAPKAQAAAYSGGNGTKSDPYQIATTAHWEMYAAIPDAWVAHFVLTADLDFGGSDIPMFAPDTDPVQEDFQGSTFTGVLDGNGHVIRHGQINLPSNDYVGLVGCLGEGGMIQNLGVEAVAVTGKQYVGGLVGYNEKKRWLDEGTVESCYATGAVSGSSSVGGLVGSNNGLVTSCYATGVVAGTSNVGGLVGNNRGRTESCYATGAVTGDTGVGGLVGAEGWDAATAACFWDMTSSGQSNSPQGRGLTAGQMRTISIFQNAGWGTFPWVMTAGEAPRLAWEGLGWPAVPEPGPVPLAGSGTEADPFQIASASDFALLSWHFGILDKHIVLTQDVDLTYTSLYPIGDLGAFTGVFDGAGHVLHHGQIYLPDRDHVGLFRVLGYEGVIRNLGVESIDVTGGSYVGGLVGQNLHGLVESCYTTGAVTGNSIVGGLVGENHSDEVEFCYATGPVTGSEYGVGGLVGENVGVVRYCYATGAVAGSQEVGGLVGRSGTVTSCYATGAVTGNALVGGLVGWDGEVTSCYATGTVTGNDNVGGLVGGNYNETVTASYATGAVSDGEHGKFYVGGLVGFNLDTVTGCFWEVEGTGQNGSSGGKGLTASQMKTVQYFQNANWNAYDWVMTAGQYPRLSWEGQGGTKIPPAEAVPLSGSGTAGDPFRIVTAADFALLSGHSSVLDKHLRLMNDVDLSGVLLYPIGDLGPFMGVFDGAGHVLRNGQIDMPEQDYSGLFGMVAAGGVIRNLGVENVSVTGESFVGGLVGKSYGGMVAGCYATGSVTGLYMEIGGLVGELSDYYGGWEEGDEWLGEVISCYATAAVTGYYSVGGLVGDMFFGGTVSSCYATGAVTGDSYVAGLVGSNYGTVTACYATGAVTGDSSVAGLVGSNHGTVTACYATGAVTGNSYVRGLIGHNYGTVIASYWDKETSGRTSSSGGEGRTTDEMTYPYAPNTYVEWDFEAVWAEDTDYSVNSGYPYLRDYVLPVAHPADTNGDFRMVLGEAIAYLTGWQQGGNPMAHAIRAAYLWQNGEVYSYDSEAEPPLCWVLGPIIEEGEVPIEGEYAEGEGEVPLEGEGEVSVEGEGELVEGEGEFPMEGEGSTETILLPGNVPLVLVRIPAGMFQMGSPDTERSRYGIEGPVHTVTINYDFYMGKYEVTQAQWLAVMGSSPGVYYIWDYGQGDTYPAYYVSWDDAQAFIMELNTHITNTGQGPTAVRLPSEAEWEYACRAGSTTRFYFGDSLGVGDVCENDGLRSQYMWYCGNNNPDGSKPVGGKLPNTFGLYDMSGNVWEWCQDWYHLSYTGAPADGSAWESPTDPNRVLRGGVWNYDAQFCRSAFRASFSPSARSNTVGFRLAAVP